MRPLLSLKTLLRTPFKTILTFLLIAVASFALFSRITDYAVTSREMKEAESRYRGVAALDNDLPRTNTSYMYSSLPPTVETLETDPLFYYADINTDVPVSLTREQIEMFSELSAGSTRYMTGGVINDYERLNPLYADQFDWGYDYTARFIMEGTFVEARWAGSEWALDEFDASFPNDIGLKFENARYIIGDAFTEDEDGAVYIAAYSSENRAVKDSGGMYYSSSISYGDEFSATVFLDAPPSNSVFVLGDNPYGYGFAESLKEGSRYLIIGRTVPTTLDPEKIVTASADMNSRIAEFGGLPDDVEFSVLRGADKIWNLDGKSKPRIGDNDTIAYTPSFYELDGFSDNYLDTPEFARVKELIEISNKDLHTFDIVYTDNMLSIPRFNEGAMTIREGRALTPEDENACVVSWYFYEKYGLSVGDKLTVELGDKLFEQNAGLGAITCTPEREWGIADTAQLEIVGVYFDTDPEYVRNSEHFWGYSPNTVFVPLSLLPIEIPAEHEIMPGEFSIVIENPRDIDAFLESATPLAESLNLALRFSDGGFAAAREHIDTSKFTALLTAVLYVSAAGLALLLAAYLYIGRGKKAYAIMRALGTPRRKAGNTLALPFGFLSIIAILSGGFAGLFYVSNVLTSALESLSEIGYTANTSLPVSVIALCLFLEFAFVILLTSFFLLKMSKTPPLALLQGETARIAEVENTAKLLSNMPLSASETLTYTKADKITQKPQKADYGAVRHVLSYIFKHMRRVGWKTAISLTLAIVLTGAIGVLTLTNVLYRELYKTVDVKSTATNFSSVAVDELSNSDLVENLYFYSNHEVSLNKTDSRIALALTNDLERYLGVITSDYAIEYAEGFSDTSFFADNGDLCILGSEIAELLGVKAGDNLTMTNWAFFEAYSGFYYFNEDYRDNLRSIWAWEYPDGMTEEEFEERVIVALNEELDEESVSYKVAGIISCENKNVNAGIFTPPGEAAAVHGWQGAPYSISYSEFMLSDNNRLEELQAELTKLSTDSKEYSNDAGYYTDTTQLDNIRRVRDLLAMLYPVAVTGAILIGLTAPGLIVVQSAKEAALLRILGTTKKRVRCMLVFEQVLLCTMGILLSAAGLVIYNSGLFMQSTQTLILCGVLYLLGCIFAALAAAISVTKRKALELLQVKE